MIADASGSWTAGMALETVAGGHKTAKLPLFELQQCSQLATAEYQLAAAALLFHKWLTRVPRHVCICSAASMCANRCSRLLCLPA